ncbi:MAG: ABC transporter ATP-binding protein [Spirochaetes bacterium]|nr:ABC transporter ATP-binding protein [Spirochaetota bacterium]
MIECKNVNFTSHGREILKNINLFVQGGEIVGIIGPGGCGKSTLCNILNGTIKSHDGEVLINNRPLRSFSQNERARHVSTIFGIPENTEITVFEFILLSRTPFKKLLNPFSSYDIQIAEEYLEGFELTKHRDSLLCQLSPAQLKLVLLAFAFTRQADVIVLDDATESLDLRGLTLLHKTLIRYVVHGNTAAILTSNDINFIAQTADKIAIVSDGSIQMIGGHEIIDADIIKQYFNVDVFISKNVYNGRPNVHFFPEG